ncbi:MAG: nucleoside triphosphate pyrophosphohydrolase [Pseudohongiellaceae bacterium]
MEKLISVTNMLRDREHGCPWDLEQSISSLAPYTLEEVYEVVSAIESGDMADLEDELGDLLFQVTFYAQIASEEGHFNFADVADAITRKLIRRHPHVFPEGKVELFGHTADISAEQVVVNWEAIKAVEREEKRQQRGIEDQHEPASILADVPQALPALERARKLQNRAANVGFDWEDVGGVLAKLKEEITEFEEAVAAADPQQINAELGDILFAVVNLARHTRIEAEVALRSSNRKFERRFQWIEAALLACEKNIAETELSELEALWQQAKEKGL